MPGPSSDAILIDALISQLLSSVIFNNLGCNVILQGFLWSNSLPQKKKEIFFLLKKKILKITTAAT